MYDIIGSLYAPAEDGQEPVVLPGWHVNSPHPVEGWEQYRVEPAAPRRVFAGHPTYCYKFPSKEAFKELVGEDEPHEL
jgi:hypothetical protein